MYKIPQTYNKKRLRHVWEFLSQNNELLMLAARYDAPDVKKEVIPFIFENDGWINKAPTEARPLFGLNTLISKDNAVYITEGEKCASSMQSMGFAAVTSLGGCGAASKSDFSPLSGYEDIYILQDNDASGELYGRDVYDALMKLKLPPARIYSVVPPNLPDKGDVIDWLQPRLPEWDGYSPIPTTHRESLREELLATIDSCKVLMTDEWESPQDEWNNIVPFNDMSVSEIPANLFPKPFAEYASALATSIEVPESMVVMSILGAVSTAVAKRFVISPKDGWLEPINTYTLIALLPANNKSFVLRCISEPLVTWEKEQAKIEIPKINEQESRRKTEEKLISVMRKKASEANSSERNKLMNEVVKLESALTKVDTLPCLFANDATPESLANSVCEQGGRFAVLSDEGGVIETLSGLYSGGQANVDILLKGIDGGHARVRRKDRAYDINPFLTLLLTIQPQILLNMKSKKSLTGNGFLERFLYVIPRSNLGYRTNDKPAVPKELTESYNRAIAKLLAIKPLIADEQENPRVLFLTDAAKKEFQDFRNHIEVQLRDDGKLYHCLGWGGKICGYSLRIAGQLHVMEHGLNKQDIDIKTMQTALEIAALLIDHALAAFGFMGGDIVEEDAKGAAKWLIADNINTFTKSEILAALKNYPFGKAERLNKALERLALYNIISVPDRDFSTGKPTRRYKVNPSYRRG